MKQGFIFYIDQKWEQGFTNPGVTLLTPKLERMRLRKNQPENRLDLGLVSGMQIKMEGKNAF